MLARMLVRENAGVAGYSEAFMYGQSGKQASIGSGYLITDVLGLLSDTLSAALTTDIMFFFNNFI